MKKFHVLNPFCFFQVIAFTFPPRCLLCITFSSPCVHKSNGNDGLC
jgi:hypothetical protein